MPDVTGCTHFQGLNRRGKNTCSHPSTASYFFFSVPSLYFTWCWVWDWAHFLPLHKRMNAQSASYINHVMAWQVIAPNCCQHAAMWGLHREERSEKTWKYTSSSLWLSVWPHIKVSSGHESILIRDQILTRLKKGDLHNVSNTGPNSMTRRNHLSRCSQETVLNIRDCMVECIDSFVIISSPKKVLD